MKKKILLLSTVISAVVLIAVLLLLLNAPSENALTVLEIQDVSGTATAQTAIYQIAAQSYYYEDVAVNYPVIEIYNNAAASKKINDSLKKELFAGMSENEIEDYKGVLTVAATYTITYFDSSIVSFYLHIDIAAGMARGAEYHVGQTYSVADGEILSLSDFEITMDKLQAAAKEETFSVSTAIRVLHDYDPELYSPYTMLSDVNLQSSNNFFLSEGAVGIIVPTEPSDMREYNGVIQIPLKWARK